MSHFLVLGAGKMGIVLAKGLIESDSKNKVTLMDIDSKQLERASEFIKNKRLSLLQRNIEDKKHRDEIFEGNLIWEYEEAFEISMKEAELKERQKKEHKIEIPFILEKDLDRIHQEKNMLHVVLKNRTGDEEVKKQIEFRL